MTRNYFGIDEPRLDVRQVLPLHRLQIVFTPLVAFDELGQRLGMGGGFTIVLFSIGKVRTPSTADLTLSAWLTIAKSRYSAISRMGCSAARNNHANDALSLVIIDDISTQR